MDNINYSTYNTTAPFDRFQVAAILTAPVIVTNLALVFLICSKEELRTASNAIICSSCFACMTLAILLITNAIVSIYASQLQSKLLLCILNRATELAASANITFHITMISVERFYSVVYPFKYQRFATNRNTCLLILGLWSIPVVTIYLPVVVTSLTINGHCQNWYNILTLRIIFHFILFPIVFVLPPVMTFIAYTAIMYKIFAMTKKIWSQWSCNSNCRRISRYQLMMAHRKALFQMLLLLSIYSISFFPFFTFYTIYTQSKNQQITTGTYISYLIAVTYILIHPLLSILFTAPIKEELRLKCKQLFNLKCFQFGDKTDRTPTSTVIDDGFKSAGHDYNLDIKIIKVSSKHSSYQPI